MISLTSAAAGFGVGWIASELFAQLIQLSFAGEFSVLPLHITTVAGDCIAIGIAVAAIGHFLVRDVEVFDGKDEWQIDAIIDTFAEDARLSEDELRAYWAGARRPGLIFVKGATPNAYPVRWEGVGHPQNFIYL